MKTITNQFKSRKAAADHLISKGWRYSATSFGDWVFTHPAKHHRNIIVQLKNRSWKINAWG